MMVMRTSAPGLAMGLVLGVGCFSEPGVYDDCARADCESTGEDSTTAGTTTVGVETSATATTTTTTSPDSGEVDSDPPLTTSATESSGSDGVDSSSTVDEGSSASCGDGVIDPPEECEDDGPDPHDGCHECQLTPALSWSYQLDHGSDGLPDGVLALAADGNDVMAAAVVAGDFDDALWFRLDGNGFLAPGWGQLAQLAENNRVLAIAQRGGSCVLGGYVNGFDGVSTAAGNVFPCDSGLVGAFLAVGSAEQAAPEQIRAMAVHDDGSMVIGGQRVHDGAMRGWIAELDASGQSLTSTTWLDDDVLFGESSEVNAIAIAPDGTVLVAGSYIQAAVSRGFAMPLDMPTMPAPFAPLAEASVATDVVPLPTGMAVSGWIDSGAGDTDARIELFPMGGGMPTIWTLEGPDDQRLSGLAADGDGVVATGSTSAAATGRDVLVVWLDDDLGERFTAVWNSAGTEDDVATDIVATPAGVTIGGNAAGQLLVQRWVAPAR